jgi:hypothetical protein
MQNQPPPFDVYALEAFVALAGRRVWARRMAEIGRSTGRRHGVYRKQRHAIELAIERLRGPLDRAPTATERQAADIAGDAVTLSREMIDAGRTRLQATLGDALTGDGTLAPLFHMLHTARMQRRRGFAVAFAGLEQGKPYDLLLTRGASVAEVACDVVSAEQGRAVQRVAWSSLADRVEADLRAWLDVRPGGYLLNMTLPFGLRDEAAAAQLHASIRDMLQAGERRSDAGGNVLRLDSLAGRPPVASLLATLRGHYGPEAQLAATTSREGVFVMACRAGRIDEVATIVRHRLAEIAPCRLTSRRPGILAMLLDDIDRDEWRGLRERLELEGEARQFLANKSSRGVIAVTCTSRFELLEGEHDDVASGELRFRNSAHPQAKVPALAPAVLSTV